MDDEAWGWARDTLRVDDNTVHFHGVVTPIRRRRRPYANEPGSPWTSTWSIDLTTEQQKRLLAMLSAPSRPIVMGSYMSYSHEPENP